jgi:enoyl-CoA hydratase
VKENGVAIRRKEGIATVSFQGRSALNLLTEAVVARLDAAVQQLAADAGTRVVILRGAGTRAFSGGVDVRMMKEFTARDMERFIRALHTLMAHIMALPRPVIAAVNGPCLGGAFELAMACDLRFAAEDSVFGLPEVKVGVPSVIEASLLARMVGWGRAAELILTGETIDAAEALRIGLLGRTVAAAALDGECLRVARELASLSPYVLAVQKDIMRKWLELGHEQGAAYSIKAMALCFATKVPREGMEAFLEKRPPRYEE